MRRSDGFIRASNHAQADPETRPGSESGLGFAERLYAPFRRWSAYWEVRDRLSVLDQRALKDIGLNHDQVRLAALYAAEHADARQQRPH